MQGRALGGLLQLNALTFLQSKGHGHLLRVKGQQEKGLSLRPVEAFQICIPAAIYLALMPQALFQAL